MAELHNITAADYRDEAQRLRATARVANEQAGRRLFALAEVFEACAKSKETHLLLNW
jgi:hypothetical protein